ncbi:peroxisome biogenesis factor 6 [Pelomyxa schiedti]|nr:peroxisome biogenesis factor 6 [Pelomyxa schiedti]
MEVGVHVVRGEWPRSRATGGPQTQHTSPHCNCVRFSPALVSAIEGKWGQSVTHVALYHGIWDHVIGALCSVDPVQCPCKEPNHQDNTTPPAQKNTTQSRAKIPSSSVITGCVFVHVSTVNSTGWWCSTTKSVFIRPVNPAHVTLSIVLAYAPSHQEWVHFNASGVTINESRGLVATQGKTFQLLLAPDVSITTVISSCEPLYQGVIGAETTLVLLPPNSSSSILAQPAAKPPSSIHWPLPIFSTPSPASALSHLPICIAPTKALTVAALAKAIFDPQPSQNVRDITTEIGVTLQTLKSINVFSGSLVRVSVNGGSKVAKIFAVDPPMQMFKQATPAQYTHDTVYMPPTLLLNLKLDEPYARHSISLRAVEDNLLPTIGTEVHISRVKCPNSSGTENYETELSNYFSHPRLVQVGDIVPIPITNFPSLVNGFLNESVSNLLPSGCSQCQRHIFFLVSRVIAPNSTEYCLVSRDGTKLIQEGSVNCHKPPKFGYFCDSLLPAAPLYSGSIVGFDNVELKLRGLIETILGSEGSLHPHTTVIPADKEFEYGKVDLLAASMGILLHGPSGSGKRLLLSQVADSLGLHYSEISCFDHLGQPETRIGSSIINALNQASSFSPCVVCLCSIEAFESPEAATPGKKKYSTLAQILSEWRIPPQVALVGTASQLDNLSPTLRCSFPHQVQVPVPTENVRRVMLEALLSGILKTNFQQELALRTAGFLWEDLKSLVTLASNTASQRVLESIKLPRTAEMHKAIARAGLLLNQSDFNKALADMQARQATLIGRPKIPNVKWTDVGGLESVKKEILDTIQLPLAHPELFPPDVKHRSGLLLYGPPGTGKTLLAKAVATELSLNFLSVKGPELINMYVGESERNIRQIFQNARDASPCVIFFDEIDSLAPKRGAGADSGGVMDRVVSQLLAELDGVHKASSVFVIGATNRPDLVDPALLCPGRFDRLLYLGIPSDPESKEKVLRALTKKFQLDPSVDLVQISRACPQRLTGADLYALCADALLTSTRRIIANRDSMAKPPSPSPLNATALPMTSTTTSTASSTPSSSAPSSATSSTENQGAVVTEEDFHSALSRLTPSVSEQELEYYHSVQKKFNNSTNTNTGSSPAPSQPQQRN